MALDDPFAEFDGIDQGNDPFAEFDSPSSVPNLAPPQDEDPFAEFAGEGPSFEPGPAEFPTDPDAVDTITGSDVSGPIPDGAPQASSIVDPTERDYALKQEEGLTGVAGAARSLSRGMASGLLRGGEMAADTLEWFSPEGTTLENIGAKISGKLKKAREDRPGTFGESKRSQAAREKSGWNPRGWFFGGGESFGMMAPGLATGAATGPLGAAVVTGGLFWGGTAQESYEEINKEQPDLPEMDKIVYANAKGFTEGGLESIQQLIPFGIAKAIPKRLKSQIVKKAVGGKIATDLVKDYLKMISSEAGMEMFQEWSGGAIDYKYNLREDLPDLKEVSRVIGPTIIATSLLGTSATLGTANQRAGIQAALTDPEAPPEMRQQAVESIHQAILAEGDKELANAWMNTTAASLRDGNPIIIQDDDYYRENGINPPREVLLDSMLLAEDENEARAILEKATPEDQAWLEGKLSPNEIGKLLEPIREMGGPAGNIQQMIDSVVGVRPPVATTERNTLKDFSNDDLVSARKALESVDIDTTGEEAKINAELESRQIRPAAAAAQTFEAQPPTVLEQQLDRRDQAAEAFTGPEFEAKETRARFERDQAARKEVEATKKAEALKAEEDAKAAAEKLAKDQAAEAAYQADLKETERVAKEAEGRIPVETRKQLKKEALAEVNENPVYEHMAAARTAALDLKQIKQDYTKNSLKDIPGYQAMFTLNGRTSPDGFAQEHGYESLDDMIETFKETPAKKIAIDRAYNSKIAEWDKAETAMLADIENQQEGIDFLDSEEGADYMADELGIVDDGSFGEEAKGEETSPADTSFDFGENVETIDNTASAAHGQEVNTAPSEAQKSAENYKKAHLSLDGLNVSIENPIGSVRKWKDGNRSGEQTLKSDYGYFKGTVGFDKDHVDVFIKPGYKGGAETAYIVNQVNKDGKFDEHKIILGVESETEALDLYNSNYEEGWDRGYSVIAMPMDKFKEWVKSDEPKKGEVKQLDKTSKKADTEVVATPEVSPTTETGKEKSARAVEAQKLKAEIANPVIDKSEIPLSEAAKEVEDKSISFLKEDPQKLLKDYWKQKDAKTLGIPTWNTDAGRDLFPLYSASNDARAEFSMAVHESASWVVNTLYKQDLLNPVDPEKDIIMFLAGGGGSGKTSSLKYLKAVEGTREQTEGIYDTTLANRKSAEKKIEAALKSGRKVSIIHTIRDVTDSLLDGVLPRAYEEGRTVPLSIAVADHRKAGESVIYFDNKYSNDDRVDVVIVDNRGEFKKPKISTISELEKVLEETPYDAVAKSLEKRIVEEYNRGNITEKIFKGLLPEYGREDGGKLAQEQPGKQKKDGPRVAEDTGQDEGKREEGSIGSLEPHRNHTPEQIQSALYHVTAGSNVKNIDSKGILSMQPSNWIEAGTGERYGKGEIFAFENYTDALRWAAKMDWSQNKETGSGKISIVRVVDDGKWNIDESDPLSQGGKVGNWLKRYGRVPAKAIIDAKPATIEDTKKLSALQGDEEITFAGQVKKQAAPEEKAIKEAVKEVAKGKEDTETARKILDKASKDLSTGDITKDVYDNLNRKYAEQAYPLTAEADRKPLNTSELNKAKKDFDKRAKDLRQRGDFAYDMAVYDKGAKVQAIEAEQKQLATDQEPYFARVIIDAIERGEIEQVNKRDLAKYSELFPEVKAAAEKATAKAGTPVGEDNIYLRMPLDRVRQDAKKGVVLAKKAVRARAEEIRKADEEAQGVERPDTRQAGPRVIVNVVKRQTYDAALGQRAVEDADWKGFTFEDGAKIDKWIHPGPVGGEAIGVVRLTLPSGVENNFITKSIQGVHFDATVKEVAKGYLNDKLPDMVDLDKAATEAESIDKGAAEDESASTDELRGEALEGVPAEDVRPDEEGRDVDDGATPGGTEDDNRNGQPDGEVRPDSGRSLGAQPRSLFDLASRAEPGTAKPDREGTQQDPDQRLTDDVTEKVKAAKPAANYHIVSAEQLGSGGNKTKFNNNLAAITIVKKLQAEGRKATEDEQTALGLYVGWGGIPNAFRKPDGTISNGWDNEVSQLESILSKEELDAARQSTQNAHYTSLPVVKGIYTALKRLGYNGGGRVLEPSVGTGNFFGVMPKGMRKNTSLFGIELDPLTGQIAQALYPTADIKSGKGFQEVTIPDRYFDIAIGNPPFGNEKVFDPQHRNLSKFSIHNYFFAKSLAKLRPGGILAMVVSDSLMDKAGMTQREYMSEQARFLGAIRLPNNAFKEGAGTEVTTDIVFLQKRAEGETFDRYAEESWTERGYASLSSGGSTQVNEYFSRNPDMMLGTLALSKNMYGSEKNTMDPIKGASLSKQIGNAINKLPENVYRRQRPSIAEVVKADVIIPKHTKVYGFFVDNNGDLMQRIPDTMGEMSAKPAKKYVKARDEYVPFSENAEEKIRGMIKVRDVVKDLMRAERSQDSTDADLAVLREKLNKEYDAFIKKHGHMRDTSNKTAMILDPEYALLASLEVKYSPEVKAARAKTLGMQPSKSQATKASIFTERALNPYKIITKADNSHDALSISLNMVGSIDMDLMKSLTSKDESQIIEELGDLVFNDPNVGLVPANEYLSGNVKNKLEAAKMAQLEDPAMLRNVMALEAVQPKDVDPVDIHIQMNANWLASEVMQGFTKHLLGAESTFKYIPAAGIWSVDIGYSEPALNTTRWGTEDVTATKILKNIMNGKAVTIKKDISVKDATGEIVEKSVTDKDKTFTANAKAEEIMEEFGRWLMEESTERREAISRLYNDLMNTNVEKTNDGSHLTFPGKVPDSVVEFRTHQKNAIWRLIQDGFGLLDHVVGAGKTYTMIAASMEMKRMGLHQKPMFVVPNHMVPYWGDKFLHLYPGANVLVASKKDFQKDNRQRLFARIATGEWDAVIIAHSSFNFIKVPAEEEAAFYKEQVDELSAAMAALKEEEGGKSPTVKQLAKQKDRLKEKIERLLDNDKKDDVVDMAQMGIDALFVDEAHEFKNLFYVTKKTRVAGLGNTQGSQKANDLFIKTRIITKQNGGRGVYFATGTPISNSIAEMFTMGRYLNYDNMKQLSLNHFDTWANSFAQAVTGWEIDATGVNYRQNTRFAKFVNLPELLTMYRGFADVVTQDRLKEIAKEEGKIWPIPELQGGGPQNIVVDRSEAQAEYMADIVNRAENLPDDPRKDNMLKITNDARLAGLDMRIIDPDAEDFEGSKVNVSAKNIFDIYKKWDAKKGTQLVFCDLSTPKKARVGQSKKIIALVEAAQGEGPAAEEAQEEMSKMSPDEFISVLSEFSVYDDLKAKLVAKGIPAEQIAFAHDATTEDQVRDLHQMVKTGKIRVLIGSTPKMGSGMNVQTKLVAIHHLDAPWKPSDLEQREGRGIRQGNEFFNEDPEGFRFNIFRYATSETYDSRMWQTIETKAGFIGQVRLPPDPNNRSVDDVSPAAANAAAMKAAASGNPLILEQVELEAAINQMKALLKQHKSKKFRLESTIAKLEDNGGPLGQAGRAKKSIDEDIAVRDKNTPKDFHAEFNGKEYDKKTDLGKAIQVQFNMDVASGKVGPGYVKEYLTYRGFKVTAFGGIQKNITFQMESPSGNGQHVGSYSRGDTELFDTFSGSGLLTRLDNALNSFEGEKSRIDRQADKAKRELQISKEEVAIPFKKEKELNEAQARMKVVLEMLQPKEEQQEEGEVIEGKPFSTVTKITAEDGRAYILEDLAQAVFKAGQTLTQFASVLKKKLGNAYSQITGRIRELYNTLNTHLDKITSGAEVGAIGDQEVNKVEKEQPQISKADVDKGEAIIDRIIATMKKQGQFDKGLVRARVKKYEAKIADLKRIASDAATDITEKQKQVRDTLSGLPMHVRGRAINEIVKIGTFKTPEGRDRAVDRAMGRIVSLLDQYYVSEGIKDIDQKLVKARATVVRGIKHGRTTPETLAELEKIKTVRHMSIDEIGARLDEIMPDDSTAEPTDEQVAEMALLTTFGDLRHKTGEEMAAAIEHIQNVIDTGKFIWSMKTAEQRARRAELGNMAEEVIRGDQELKSDSDKTERNFIHAEVSGFSDKSQNWQWLMDKLSRFDRDSDVLKSRLSKHFARAVHAATHRENKGITEQETLIRENLERIFGVKKRKLANILMKNSVIKEKGSGINLYDSNGRVLKADHRMSQNMAYTKWQQWHNPNLREDLIRQGITEKTMEQIEAFMTPEVKEWARWQMQEFYAGYYDGINDVYRALTYTDMPRSENYVPIRRVYHKGSEADMTVDGAVSYHSSIWKGSHKMRVKNNLDIAYMDGDAVLAQHIAEMEHFKAWALVARDMRSVFGRPKVRKAIKDHHGRKMLQTVDLFIEDFVRGGVEARNNIALIDALRSLWVKTKLAGNLVVFIKQLTSIPAYAVDIPTADFVKGVAIAMANPLKATKILMESTMMQSRYDKNQIERDMKFATQKGPARQFAGTKKLSDKAMFTTRLGDKAAIILGGYANYRYNYKQEMAKHGNKERAHREALIEFEIASENTQQATARKDLSVFQTGDSIQKGMTMFMTALSSYARMWEGGVRNLAIPGIKKGRGDQITNLKRIFYAQIVLPTLFQLAASGFDWDEEKQSRARWLGPLNGLFLVRDLMAQVYDMVFLGKAWGFSSQPHLEEFSELMVKIVDGSFDMEDLAQMVNASRPITGAIDYFSGETDDERRLLGYSESALNVVETSYNKYNSIYNKTMREWKEDRTNERPSLKLKAIKKQITAAKKRGDKEAEKKLQQRFVDIAKKI